MIYLVALFTAVALVGFYFRSRANGFLATLFDMLAATAIGWIAGLFIGIGARIGMWSIPFFNGRDPRITFEGTLRVILVFSLLGIGLGLVYEFVFRRLVRSRGLLYGLLVTVIAAYPLASAALQQISFEPPIVWTVIFAFLFVGFMFIPFAVSLEMLLGIYHRIGVTAITLRFR